MKKILSLLLTISMLLCSGIGVMAYSDIEEGTYVAEAVEVLSDLGVFNGFEDGSFKPEETVTRAQMAKVVCEMLGYNNVSPSATQFTDVDASHWAAGYINVAQGLGIINGHGDGTFEPEGAVTYEQAVKMIVCTLGFEPMAATKGGWSAGYLSVANTYGITDNVNNSTRGGIAVLVYNAIDTPVMERVTYGNEAEYAVLDGNGKEYKTLLTSKNIHKITGTVDSVNTKDIDFTITATGKDPEFANKTKVTFEIGDSNITDYVYQEVDLYVEKDNRNKYTILSINGNMVSETFTLVSDDIVNITVADENGKYHIVEYYVDSLNNSKTKTLYVDKDATIEYNKTAGYTIDILDDAEDIEILLIENDGDRNYDAVVAIEYISERLEMVDAYKDKIVLGGKNVEFDYDNEDKTYILVDADGNELTLNDFEEDDVIAYVTDTVDPRDADYIKIVRLTDAAFYGTVETMYNSEEIVVINDEEYKVASGLNLELGDEGMFYVGITGKIIEFEGMSLNSKYGYILASRVVDSAFDDEMQVKMLTTNGVKTYTLTEKAEKTFDIEYDWDADSASTVEAARLVEYSLNGKDEIVKITPVKNYNANMFVDKEYNADTEILSGHYIDKDSVVFVIGKEDAEDTFATDVDYLVDEGEYSGSIYTYKDETKVIIITDTTTAYNSEAGFAIVTSTGTMMQDDEEVFVVTYVQNEKTDTIYFEEEDVDTEDFQVGTVFAFNSAIDEYVIIANIDNRDFDKETGIYAGPGKDVEVVFGYIENEKRTTVTRGEVLTINDEKYVITSATNKYTFDADRRKDNKILTEEFLGGNAYYGNNTPVMLKLVDDVVVDIYTISPIED